MWREDMRFRFRFRKCFSRVWLESRWFFRIVGRVQLEVCYSPRRRSCIRTLVALECHDLGGEGNLCCEIDGHLEW
jgi:hypothetical protein